MQWTIESMITEDVELRMSVGVHSGECHFFLAASPHRELMVAGPGATRVFELEDLATAGEIVLSEETAAAVDPEWLGTHPRDGEILDAGTRDPPVRGIQQSLERLGGDPRISATAIQTVGAKGWDGFSFAVVA